MLEYLNPHTRILEGWSIGGTGGTLARTQAGTLAGK